MRYINRVVALALIISLIFTSKALVTFAENESSKSSEKSETTIVKEESETKLEKDETSLSEKIIFIIFIFLLLKI